MLLLVKQICQAAGTPYYLSFVSRIHSHLIFWALVFLLVFFFVLALH